MALAPAPSVYGELSVLLNTRTAHPVEPPEGLLLKVIKDHSECVTPGLPEGTPAWVDYKTNTAYFDAERIFGENAEQHVREIIKVWGEGGVATTMGRASYQKLAGFISHEISHALYSRWSTGKAYEEKLHGPTMIMEEIRVETKAVDDGGDTARTSLRQSFAWLLDSLAQNEELPSDPASIARLWALVVGRYKSGIAMWDEIKTIDNIARAALGDKVVDIMKDILDEAVVSGRFEHRLRLAQEWLDLFPEEETGSGDQMVLMGCGGHDHGEEEGEEGEEGEKDEGEGSGDADNNEDEDKDKGEGATPGDTDGDKKEGEQKKSGQGGHDPEAIAMIRRALAKSKDEVSQRRYIERKGLKLQDDRLAAAQALKKYGKRHTGHWTDRPPTAAERGHARKLAQVLTNIALPSISKEGRPSELPPGRMRSRAAVQQSAERHMGRIPTAQPWEMMVRTRTTTKPVIVGCATDVSGSMSWATEFVASFAWIVAHAGKAVGARTAAVTYGNDVDLVTKPGDTPKNLSIRRAADSTEKFDKAMGTLDGLLRFRQSTNAAKVLFIVSDGYYVGSKEVEKAVMWVEELTKAGTTIVWVGGGSEYEMHYRHAVKAPGSMRNMPINEGGSDESYYYSRDVDLAGLMKRMEAVILEAARASARSTRS